jgi:hypothetical protein
MTVEPDHEDLDIGECTGDPFKCPCEQCRDWLVDTEADRTYDERKEAA